MEICSTPYYLANAITVLGLGELGFPADAIPTIVFDVVKPRNHNGELRTIADNEPTTVPGIPEADADELVLEEPIEQEVRKDFAELEDNNFYIPIRLGVVLDRLYSALWNRESNRHNIHAEESNEWKDRTSRFASERCKRHTRPLNFFRETALKILETKKLFYWLLSVGIFDKTPRGTYRFFTELTQYYFTALLIKQLLDVGENEEADKLLSNCKLINQLSLL